MKTHRFRTLRRLPALATTAAVLTFSAQSALMAGDDSDAKAGKAVQTTPAAARIKLSYLVEAGITVNADHHPDNLNFGQLFTDRDTEPLLNQATFTAERVLVPEPGKFDWGFKLQITAGSDARYTNPTGDFDNLTHERDTFGIIEGYGNLHFPVLTEGGLDVKLGQFVTLLGCETINPTGNFFYSHSYQFNFAIPLTHLGGLATLHFNKYLDLYAGVDRGQNIGFRDNNGRPSGLFGFQLTLWDGKLVVVGSSAVGPEDQRTLAGVPVFKYDGTVGTVDPNGDLRYANDINATYKITDKLTSITDAVFTRDDGFRADCYGVAQYLTYAVDKSFTFGKDMLTIGLREEIFHDDGFYVTQYAGNDDFSNFQNYFFTMYPATHGGAAYSGTSGQTNYIGTTFGANVKVNDHVLIRPEVRYDVSTEDNKAYSVNYDSPGTGGKNHQLTAAFDVLITF